MEEGGTDEKGIHFAAQPAEWTILKRCSPWPELCDRAGTRRDSPESVNDKITHKPNSKLPVAIRDPRFSESLPDGMLLGEFTIRT